jgi:hypothetical protein
VADCPIRYRWFLHVARAASRSRRNAAVRR